MVVLSTCVVKQPTENRMVERIKKLYSSGKPLVVAGCMPEVMRDKIEMLAPKASIIGVNDLERIVDAVESAYKGVKFVSVSSTVVNKVLLPRVRLNPVVSIIQISHGCAWKKCKYCIVKLTRRGFRSFPVGDIVNRVKEDVSKGAKEIWITSQDNASYGRDIGTSIVELLSRIVELDGRFLVRVGMMNPVFLLDIAEDLSEVFKDPKIFKFIHVPVQSGSDKVLEEMGRGYTVKDFLKIVETFRRKVPKITLATDVIVGYPTETEEDFEMTLKLIKKVEPDVVNVSKFGPRPFTEAKKLKQLDSHVVKERTLKLVRLVRDISYSRNLLWVGWQGEVLIDEKGKPGTFVGRNPYYKPVVLEGHYDLGTFLKVKIKEAHRTYLKAEVVS